MGSIINAYKGPPKGARYEAWREVTCREICGLDVQPGEGDVIDCQLRIDPIGEISLAVASGGSAKFSRTRAMLADGCDDLFLVEAQWGSVPLVQGSRNIELLGSHLCLADTSVIGSIGHGAKGGYRTLRIPRRTLLRVAPRAEDMLSVGLVANDARLQLIAGYQTLCADLSSGLDSAGRHLMAQHLIDLVGLLFRSGADERDAPHVGSRAAVQLDMIRADVLRNLGHPGLAIGNLARRYGLGERQAQRLFERSGSTFTEFVLEHRLLQARKLLTDPLQRHRNISDIAHSSGFSDLSYFNRAFRKRFGVSPSEMRAG